VDYNEVIRHNTPYIHICIRRLSVMRKIIVLIAFVLIIVFSSCSNNTNIVMDIDTSDKYSQSEINSAIDVATDYFNKNFWGCELTRIEYDEEYSDSEREHYTKFYDVEDAIRLRLEFKTDDEKEDFRGCYLIRYKEDKPWEVVDCGYP